MNSHLPHYDPGKLQELVSTVLDGTSNDSQRRELTELLRTSTQAQDEYLAIIDLHAVLVTEITSKRQEKTAKAESKAESKAEPAYLEPTRTKARLTRRRWLRIVSAVAVAASLLIALIIFQQRKPIAAPMPVPDSLDSFFAIAQVTDAVWPAQQIEVGTRFGASTVRLESGFVRLEFDSGVSVTLEGPAEFEVINAAKTELKSGLLTATVSPGAEGFTVNTPNAEVVDLGTSFGIDLREQGISNVTVFDGKVETTAHHSTEKRLLTEGDSVCIGADNEIKDVHFDPQPYEKLWPTASGIVGTTETIEFIPPWLRPLRFVQSNDTIFIASECRSRFLIEPLQVNISEPGEYSNESELTPLELSSERVRSFILHYSPSERLGAMQAKRVSGSITFARPVLGLIVQHEELLASSQRFSRRKRGEQNPRRELQLTGDFTGDHISLSEDRMTITLDLISPGKSSDLVRVILGGKQRQRKDNVHPIKYV